MGASLSNDLDDDTVSPPKKTLTRRGRGWRVLRVYRDGPCGRRGLVVPYFDVVTHVNGIPLTQDESLLVATIGACAGLETRLTIYHFPTSTPRTITITPNVDWPGQGLLGMVIRCDAFASADVDAIHVLKVQPGSPAEQAGLIAFDDWLLGTDAVLFRGSYDELDYVLRSGDGRDVRFFVYNRRAHAVREVVLRPDSNWKPGPGSLGADLGIGFEHRLPFTQPPTPVAFAHAPPPAFNAEASPYLPGTPSTHVTAAAAAVSAAASSSSSTSSSTTAATASASNMQQPLSAGGV
jgi:hypothetical protein